MCSPCPGGHFVVSQNGVRYWFCSTLPPVTGPDCVAEDGGGGPGTTRMTAQSACAAKGLTLARIQTTDENRFVATLLASRVWLGGNDLQTPGQWYWSSATSDSDTLFWSGGVDGGRQGNLYVNWASGAPAGTSCLSMAPVDGYWADTDCAKTLGYVCQ
jgi:Lectin C-type domain